jgi:hypothetical protein
MSGTPSVPGTAPRKGKQNRLFSWFVLRHAWYEIWRKHASYNRVLKGIFHNYVSRGLCTVENAEIQVKRLLGVFIDACMCYAILMKLDYANVMSLCWGPKIVLDGVVLRMRSVAAFLQDPFKLNTLKKLFGPEAEHFSFLPSSMISRLDVQAKKTLTELGDLLYNFSGRQTHNPQTGRTATYGDPLSATQFKRMCEILLEGSHDEHHPLSKRFGFLCKLSDTPEITSTGIRAHQKYRDILQALSSDYPVCSLLPLDCPDELEAALNKTTGKVDLSDFKRIQLRQKCSCVQFHRGHH